MHSANVHSLNKVPVSYEKIQELPEMNCKANADEDKYADPNEFGLQSMTICFSHNR